MSIVEDGKINTNISKHELTPVAKDKSGKIITYKHDYVLELRDKDGYILTDEETVLSYTETDNKIHLNIVYNDLEEGHYILVVSVFYLKEICFQSILWDGRNGLLTM